MNNRDKYRARDHTFAVCAYKDSPYLELCIQSLLDQNIKSDIIIATSTPSRFISDVAERYNLPLFINKGEKGIANDWNFAYQCTDTALVTLAHQDDVYMPEYTERMLQSLNKCSYPLIGFTDYMEIRSGRYIKNNGLLRIKRLLLSPLKIRLLWKNRFVRRRVLSLGSAICCPSVTFVKENLGSFRFRNNMKSNIDWQAWEEISRMPGEFVYVSKTLMGHRIHEGSTTSKLIEMEGRREEDLYMYCKFWPQIVAKFIEIFYANAEMSNKL